MAVRLVGNLLLYDSIHIFIKYQSTYSQFMLRNIAYLHVYAWYHMSVFEDDFVAVPSLIVVVWSDTIALIIIVQQTFIYMLTYEM